MGVEVFPMKPIEFITSIDQYNNSFGEQMEAITEENLVIQSKSGFWQVLSYYYCRETGNMVLEIGKKK